MAAAIHVISKRNIAQHALCKLDDSPTPALAPASVRVRTRLISLSSNNLNPRGGPMLHWWDAYPVPEAAFPPFNYPEEWAIVPAWGYAQVIDSTISPLTPGALLWGFWPTSTHAVDLTLQPAEPAGHWSEVSPHRSRLMNLYNRYQEVAEEDALTALCKPVWEGGYLLNHSVFHGSDAAPVHPLGLPAPWSEQDADLSSAVVISLSASSQTGRSFAWQLVRNRDVRSRGPLALLQLATEPGSLLPYADGLLPVKLASYYEPIPMAWVCSWQPTRVVIVDFGAPNQVTEALVSATVKARHLVTFVAVGREGKPYSQNAGQLPETGGQSLSDITVQVNSGGVRERAMEVARPEKYFQDLEHAWRRYRHEGGVGNLKLNCFNGIEGSQGMEGAWQDLCDRKVASNSGIVVRLSGE